MRVSVLIRAFPLLLLLILACPGQGQLRFLNYRPIDAAYDRALDRVVMVASQPNQVIIYDPIAQQETAFISLPLAPSSISVSPDGTHAAVGHNAFVSYVNLTKATVEKTIPVACNVLQLFVGSGDYIYLMPRTGSCVAASISTGQQAGSTSGGLPGGEVGRMSVASDLVYLAQLGVSPPHMQRYSVRGGGLPVYQWDWPYHGTYYPCNNLWMSEDGLRVFTGCGSVFRLSDVQSQDMVYGGAIIVPSGQQIISAAHALKANRVLVLPISDASPFGNGGTLSSEIDLFTYDFLTLAGRLLIPNLASGGNSYLNHGRFIFIANDGSTVITILQADGATGFLNDYSILTTNLAGAVVNSANYWIAASSANQIATIFGSNLATTSASATSLPLPTTLGNALVTITPSGQSPVQASLFYVSPSQINFLIPPIPTGTAALTVSVNGQTVVNTTLATDNTAPGLYSANGDGQGAAAGQASTLTATGQTTSISTFQFNSQSRTYVTNPIAYSNSGTSSIYLTLYGTGFRNAVNPPTVTIGSTAVPVAYAGAQGSNLGLDQLNVGPLPKGLPTFNDVPVVIVADGKASNAVYIRLQ